jgi:hypothetical protein
MSRIDEMIATLSPKKLNKALQALKSRIDAANTSTVCDKTELDAEVGLVPFRLLNLARIGLGFVRDDGNNLSKI